MENKTTFLQFHNERMETGKLVFRNGLCSEEFNDDDLEYDKKFQLFMPTNDECDHAYWGDDLSLDKNYNLNSGNYLGVEYNPLRQTIILLCAAINGEL